MPYALLKSLPAGSKIPKKLPPKTKYGTHVPRGWKVSCDDCWPSVKHQSKFLQAMVPEKCDVCGKKVKPMTAKRRNPSWYPIDQSIFCPNCDYEADDVEVMVSADGRTEKYRCPNCAKINVGGNDEGLAKELRREIARKFPSSIDHRMNPSLVILSNPERVPGERAARKTWAKFHLRSGDNARATKIPDIKGMPKTVVVLGALEQVTCSSPYSGRKYDVNFKRNDKTGPWLVMDVAGKTLYLVASKAGQFKKVDVDGCCSAVAYWPGKTSGKNDPLAFKHEFGEGGKLPKKQWPFAWCDFREICEDRAIEIVRPKKNGYKIEDRGIVG